MFWASRGGSGYYLNTSGRGRILADFLKEKGPRILIWTEDWRTLESRELSGLTWLFLEVYIDLNIIFQISIL
jgi:hypothetical protein